ncbi:MAG: hypothetical protein RIQ33_1104 [Bacteroidota bacterium]|jgi:UPF0755 protein
MKRMLQKLHHLSKVKKILVVWLIIVLCIGGGLFYRLVKNCFRSNISSTIIKPEFIYIPTGARYNDVLRILDKNKLLISRNTFMWMAKELNYRENIKPGKYKIEPNMSNWQLINLLKSGNQTPVKLVIGKFRLNTQFKSFVIKHLEIDSVKLQLAFDSLIVAEKIDTTQHYKDMNGYVIQNTYEFWWNTSAEKFWKKIFEAYKKYWNNDRKLKAKAQGLTPYEAVIVASIVDEETAMEDEKPVIAGIYLNRFHKNVLLQADPTVKFALNDFAIKRILYVHLKVESPYNTYVVKGLPPGPICLPSIKSIDAVLNPIQHKFMFFCAKENFSGYHNYAETFEQHQINAKKYQKAYVDRFVLHKIDTSQKQTELDTTLFQHHQAN